MKPAKTSRSMIPSALLIVGLPDRKTSAVRRTDTAIHTGISNLMFSFVTTIGKKMAVMPRMPNILNIFEPTTLPMATSALPCNAPRKLTVSSGIEVPIPTMAAPITKSDTLYLRATATEPATSVSAPNTMPASANTNIRYSITFQLIL